MRMSRSSSAAMSFDVSSSPRINESAESSGVIGNVLVLFTL